MKNNELALIFLDGLLNLDYKHKRAIINLYDDVSQIFTNPDVACYYLKENVSTASANTFVSAIHNNFVAVLVKKYQERGITVITEESEGYPTELYPLSFRPICLYALGNVKLLNSNKKFSIVGSRKTAPHILKLTESIASDLSKNEIVIVTGVANGGDKSAIKGALESGNIICVLASGHDFIKSETNRDIIEKVIASGLVISEYPPEVPPKNYHYPIRNRIIAGLSSGTLIVSGTLTSGARHTADYALDYGKDVFAFPYGIGDLTGELCNNLIKDGAHLVVNVKDVSEVMGYALNESKKVRLTKEESEVYNLIIEGVKSPDQLSIKLDKKIYEVVPILTTLELKGVVVKNNSNEYTAIK